MARKEISNDYLEYLPNGTASEKVTKGCLVLEGGAFRGIYTSGILDFLMQHDINFECVVGVSAGALNGVNYVAGQIGRAAHINLRYRNDPRYVGRKCYATNGGVIGFDFILGDMEYIPTLDVKRLMFGGRRFVAAASNMVTAKTDYFENNDSIEKLYKGVQASATMPYISKPVMIDDVPYLDGGCIARVPYKWAIDQGYEKIVVVRTRDLSYRKKPNYERRYMFTKRIFSKYPEFAEIIAHSHDGYNKECDELEKLAKDGRIFMISPTKPITIGRLEKNVDKLAKLYNDALIDAGDYYPKLVKYLNAK